MTIAILSLQGAVQPHFNALAACGADARLVRYPHEIADCDGLIIPGGESTTIGKLIVRFGLEEPIRELHARRKPIWGTCAGMILLATEIEESDQWRLGLMDAAVRRNAFGRQVDSFETDLPVPVLGDDPFRAVFIRAPYLTRVGDSVENLASFQDKCVLARQRNVLASAFHPELTNDRRLHQYFLSMLD
ncbi:MAG: pyridoxal 5'-phosphate synthase glutaminase subunit PdxT, partial [Armatimonadota bacterium]